MSTKWKMITVSLCNKVVTNNKSFVLEVVFSFVMVTGTANDLSFHLLFILITLSVVIKMRIYADAMKINPMD